MSAAFDEMDDRVFYHLEMNADGTDVAIRITSDVPFSQDEFLGALLCFVDDCRKADEGTKDEWLFRAFDGKEN